MNAQYKKGVLELLILSRLNQGDQYGYDVSESLSQRIDIADGTVYPILRKLKSEGLVSTYLSEQSGGPPRKYYSLTPEGKAAFARAKAEWLHFVTVVQQMLEEDFDNE